jgi:hypothetical protein
LGLGVLCCYPHNLLSISKRNKKGSFLVLLDVGRSKSWQEDCGKDVFCTERVQGTAIVEEESIQRVKRAKYGRSSSSGSFLALVLYLEG